MDDPAWQFYRSAGTLMIAPLDLDESVVQDILDSLLLAQLAANKQHDPFRASLPWRKTWTRTLEALHWTTTTSSGQEEAHSEAFTMASLFALPLGTLPALDLAALFGELKTVHLHALEPYCRRNRDGSTSLRLTLCLAHSADRVNLGDVAFEAATSLEPNWLTQEYPTDSQQSIRISKASYLYMRQPGYAAERSKVIERLGANRMREIERIRPALPC